MNKSPLSIVSLLLVFSLLPGCAAVTALKHADKKNLEVLDEGTARENVIMYLGAPASSEKEDDGRLVDIYSFRQGYSTGNKATRAATHIILDVLTIFIWEIVAWPAEAIFDGEQMTVKVIYDQNKRITDINFLQQAI